MMLEASNPHADMIRAGLSPREAQVLELLLSGVPQKAISLDLGLSPKTVNTYKSGLMRKLEAPHDVALILRAIELRFLEAPKRRKRGI